MPTEVLRILKIHFSEMFSKAQIRQTFVYTFPVHNALKQGHASSPYLFNFVLECAITKVQEKHSELKSNWDILLRSTIMI
jgi:hypothetical protein